VELANRRIVFFPILSTNSFQIEKSNTFKEIPATLGPIYFNSRIEGKYERIPSGKAASEWNN